MDYIKRDKYLHQIIPFIDKQIIKVITGQRRVGKSYFLKQVADYIRLKDGHAHIVFIDKELYDFHFINTADDLIRYVQEQSAADDGILFIDEVQEIKEYERAVRHFFSKGYDIYLSGSNSDMLSGDLATMLSGRYIQIQIHPLTYPEFCTFHQLNDNKQTLDLYFRYGGMPYLKNLTLSDETAFTYLQNLYQTILLKDVVSRYQIKNVDLLERLVLFLADNTGSIVSAKKINDFLKSQHLKISNSVIINYLNFLDNAFFVNKTRRYDLHGKRILEVGEKYYFSDHGIRNALTGYRPNDINKVLENVVYAHLLANGYEVNVGKLYGYEIDFVAQKNRKIIYVQAAYLLADDTTINREFGNLQKIKDNYPKMVVTMDEQRFDTYHGIAHYHIREFLNKNDFN
jgi:predicted AAA+ superfamily ATPase